MTDEVVLRALAALDEVSLRELEVAGERLSLRRDGLQAFGQVFADVAKNADGGFGQSRYHLKNAIDAADDRLLERIEHAAEPFWAHVRDAAGRAESVIRRRPCPLREGRRHDL